MTTIAYKDGQIAVDSCVSEHSYKIPGSAVKFTQKGQWILFVTGDAGRQDDIFTHFTSLHMAQQDYYEIPCLFPTDTKLIVFDTKTKLVTEIYRRNKDDEYVSAYTYAEDSVVAFGSGLKFAMGAMMAGATPTEAVKIASELDVRTGGEIHTFPL